VTSAVPVRETGGVVLDIEGTTTPVSFVYDVLFPYARVHLREFLHARLGDVHFERAISLLREEHTNDTSSREPVPEWPAIAGNVHIDGLGDYLEWLMDRDRKSPGLKLVQGQIWERGYADGTLRGEVYADVLPAFERWRGAGLTIAIYSSGSVLAQRLLFRNSTSGDLTPFIKHYFDTSVGPKRTPESYRRIAHALRLDPDELCFISDIDAELVAARDVGFQTLSCVRPPSSLPASSDSPVVQTFDDVDARIRLSVPRS
jgi:enolase-phosphatase E1